MEIQFKGQYTRSTFFSGVRLANRPKRNQKRFSQIMMIFSVAALGLIAYRVVGTGDFGGDMVLLVGAILLGGITAWVYLVPVFTAWKLWRNPGTRRALKGQINNRGIRYQLETGINEIRWERFNRVRKTDRLVALVRDDGLLVLFPVYFFKKPADWKKFITLIEQKYAQN